MRALCVYVRVVSLASGGRESYNPFYFLPLQMYNLNIFLAYLDKKRFHAFYFYLAQLADSALNPSVIKISIHSTAH